MIFYHVVYYFNLWNKLAEDGLHSNWSFLPNIVAILLKSQNKIGGFGLEVFNYGDNYVQVLKGSLMILSQIVNIYEQTYSYGKWAIYKIPCIYALEVLAKWRITYDQFIDQCYKMDAYA